MVNQTEADNKGVLVYDFEIKHSDQVPVSDFQELLKRLDDKAYTEPKYDTLSVAKGKKVIFIPPRLIITGEAVNIGVDSIGQKWKEYLPRRIQENIEQKCPNLNRLSPVQHWIATIILFDFPGVVFCGNGHFSSDIMIVSLAARVYNAAKSHVCGNYYNDVNCAEELVGKEFETQSKKRPHSILICPNTKAANSIRQKLKWIFNGTRITWEHVTSEVVDNNHHIKHCELLVGTARIIRDYIKKFDVPLTQLDSIYVTSCHLYKPKSGRTRALMDVFELLNQRSTEKISPYFFYRRHVDIYPFFEKMLSQNYTIISTPPKRISEQPTIKLCLCNEEHTQFNLFQKLSWLSAIVDKIRSTEKNNKGHKLNKSTLIICDKSETVRCLAAHLTNKYDIVFPCITTKSHIVGIERARNLFRSRTTDFMILDYFSLALLEPGHIANTVLYDLPPATTFLKDMHMFSKLSEKIDDSNNRQIYLILDPEVDAEVIIPAHEYITAIGGKISQTFEVFYNSMVESRPVKYVSM